MSDDEYLPRIVDSIIAKKLRTTGAVLIEGAKFVGKSTTGAHFSNSIVNLDDSRGEWNSQQPCGKDKHRKKWTSPHSRWY